MVKSFFIRQVQGTKSYTPAPLKRINCVNLTEEEEVCKIQVWNY